MVGALHSKCVLATPKKLDIEDKVQDIEDGASNAKISLTSENATSPNEKLLAIG